jgi:hypothetical protein
MRKAMPRHGTIMGKRFFFEEKNQETFGRFL